MKLKGVNPLEQHVEKIVLAAVSVIFLGVLAMQFLVEPNKVKVGNAAPVPPGRAFDSVEAKAREIDNIMKLTDLGPRRPDIPTFDLVKQLTQQREAPLVPAREFALGPKLGIEGSDKTTAAIGNDRITPISLPAAAHVLAATFRGTLDPTEPENIPELKPFVPTEQPLDTKAVSVACTLDGTAIRQALSGAPTAPGAKPIPLSWWRDGMEVLSVRLERQEQQAGGNWSDATEVAPPPGRFSMAERLKGVRSSQDLADAVAEARGAAEDIQRPAFYRTIAPAQAWAPPAEGGAAAEAPGTKNPEVDRAVAKANASKKSVEAIQKRIDETTQAPVRQPAPRGGEGGGGGGGGGKGAGGGGGGQAPGQTSGPSMTQQEKDSRLKTLNSQLKTAQAQLAKDIDALKALNRDESGKPLAAAGAGETGKTAAAKPLLDNDQVKLWSHDMTVQPGKTYRYRVKVGVNNPAFARTSALVPEQQELAAAAVIYSQPTDWSEPVQVLPDQFFFLTGATEADSLGPPRATAEGFKFFYGYYRKTSVSLEPGDTVSANIKLPDANKLPIYDLKAAPQAGGPAPGAPQPPPEAPMPGGKGRMPQPGREERTGGGGNPGQPNEKPQVTLPANAKPYSKSSITAAIDAMLLDVAKTVATGEGGARSEAYMRGSDGQIVVLSPDEQRKSPVYQMAAASAKEGENQGQPAAPAEPTKKDPNTPPPPKTRAPTPPPPGGGGGGGAGGG